ncbi:MAG: glycoside hydrolase family 3 N-terminal domain-containing protein, partial [Bacillota bacterium]|nr:glycoside hydrolase family 3 N-terminal domain-containing protein [Bacillota bacterium]
MNIQTLLKELTLEEKARLCMGADSWQTEPIERLSIPSVRTSDGPHGLRKKEIEEKGDIGINESVPATCFPPAALTSCSFNRELFSRMGQAIAQEAIEQDIDVVLGPAVNVKRSPLCGRNFEYVSEDPYLAGEYAAEYIDGMQKKGIGTSLKHYAVNSQETLRMNIDAAVDERALREIYLYAFEHAVKKSQPFT